MSLRNLHLSICTFFFFGRLSICTYVCMIGICVGIHRHRSQSIENVKRPMSWLGFLQAEEGMEVLESNLIRIYFTLIEIISIYL